SCWRLPPDHPPPPTRRSSDLRNDAEADATLSGSLTDFLALAAAQDKANTLINSAIDMSGDSEFALGLTRIAQQLDIDWEALLSRSEEHTSELQSRENLVCRLL